MGNYRRILCVVHDMSNSLYELLKLQSFFTPHGRVFSLLYILYAGQADKYSQVGWHYLLIHVDSLVYISTGGKRGLGWGI